MTLPAARGKSAPNQLRSSVLSVWEVIAQAVAGVAPTVTPALIAGLVFASAGNGTWLSYLLATIAMLLVAYNINIFARRSNTTGALYNYVAGGLGPLCGVICGWSLVIAYTVTCSACVAEVPLFLNSLLRPVFPAYPEHTATYPLMLLTATAAWWIAWKDVQLSTRVMLALESVSVAMILILVFLFFSRNDRWVDPPQIHLAGLTPGALRVGLVLAIFSFVGFEGATALGREANDARRTVPIALLSAVIISGAFFIITSYALVAGFRGHNPPLDKIEAPLNELAIISHVPLLGSLLNLGAAISVFSGCLALVTAGARVLFTMSRHGLFHLAAGGAHHKNATPHIALTFCMIIAAIVPLALFYENYGLLDIATYTATTATFGFIFAYVLVSLAAPVFLGHRGELTALPLLVSIASLALLSLPVIGSVYPVPDPPLNYLPWIFLVLLAPGVLRFAWLRNRQPRVIDSLRTALETAS